jgi:hypothetical protein
MADPHDLLPSVGEETRTNALRIARLCRFVVQAFLPTPLQAEAERRFFLVACGVLNHRSVLPAPPEGGCDDPGV